MRIVIDMQGAQTESRFRGIGRYTMSFARAVVRNRGEHEIILALSGLFPDTIEPIRTAFDGLLPQENIRVWQAPGPVNEEQPGNDARRETAELVREAFLAGLQPDVIHISSLFEGFIDDAVTSLGRFDTVTPVSVILYDLIPLLNPDHYLKPKPRYENYYLRKVDYLRQAATCLAISDFSRRQGIHALGVSGDNIINISTAIDAHFRPKTIDVATANELQQRFGINRPFVLYAGGADERKNLPRLIDAYGALSPKLRASHRLVFAGRMPEGEVSRLRGHARSAGLKRDELCFTGYLPDAELVQLYNLCDLYVFPSWHEGFGLPALEAMACGAPVIAANTTSLPEVIGLEEALFDPFDAAAISQKMAQALHDEVFRNRLHAHGLQQAQEFSWDETAKRAIAAWEARCSQAALEHDWWNCSLAYERLIDAIAAHALTQDDACLASLASCLEKNQSAGTERQILLDVSELCQRDAATGVQRVVRGYLKWLLQSPPAGFRVEPIYATQREGYRYARRFTLRFLGQDVSKGTDDPIRWQRGDIFFGLDMQHHVQLAHVSFYRQLMQDGVTVKFLVYDLLPIQLANLFKDSNAKELHERWLTLIAATDGAICISKCTADALETWIKEAVVPRSPTFRTCWVHIGGNIDDSNPSRGLPDDAEQILETLRQRPTLLCVSTLEPRKRQIQVLEAVEQLWEERTDLNLVLVGQQGWQTESLANRLRSHSEQGQRLYWLDGISDEYLEKVYAASTCLVAASVDEGFGLPLIEAARHGIPIIARDIPVFREVAGDHVYYFRGEAPHVLAQALKAWLGLYHAGQHPQSTSMSWSTWQESAEKLKTALIEQNYPRRQLLVDICELVERDVRTGIQRVVRSILREWLCNPPEGYRVEPVYATTTAGYRYARQFTHRFLGLSNAPMPDEPIDYAPGDIFFGLDLQPQVQGAQRAFYQTLRRQGVQVQFLIHDLLCVRMPQYFPPRSSEGLARWLEVVAESDGVVCVSKTTAEDFANWIKENAPARLRAPKVAWSYNGADVDNSHPGKGFPVDAETTLDQLRARPGFLMVGTLEPRKGHGQVLDAFELLWRSGIDANLAIVGREGWMVGDLVSRLRSHPELNQRLFWLEGISDEYLGKVYAASTCLIAASFGEGFGLPLIEAAQHGLPVVARDIPVFREVAGKHAYYFDGLEAEHLASAVNEWLALHEQGIAPSSDRMPRLTWGESARCLLRLVAPEVGKDGALDNARVPPSEF